MSAQECRLNDKFRHSVCQTAWLSSEISPSSFADARRNFVDLSNHSHAFSRKSCHFRHKYCHFWRTCHPTATHRRAGLISCLMGGRLQRPGCFGLTQQCMASVKGLLRLRVNWLSWLTEITFPCGPALPPAVPSLESAADFRACLMPPALVKVKLAACFMCIDLAR